MPIAMPWKVNANWKLVKTDSQHEGWINSWRDRAGLPPCVEDFLHHLLVWLLWLNDDANRNHTKIAAQACFVQYACQHKTELLYMHRKHATKVMIPFLEPLLQDRELSCRFPTLLSLTAANLEIIANRPAGRSRPSLPPPPTTPKRLRDSEAPSSKLGTWIKYMWQTDGNHCYAWWCNN